MVHLMDGPEDPGHIFRGEQAVGHLAGVGGAALLGIENVHRDDDAHYQVHHKVHHGPNAAADDQHQLLGLGEDILGHPVQEGVEGGVHLRGDPGAEGGVIFQEVVHPAVDGVVIGLQVIHQLHNAPVELRKQEGAQQVKKQPDDQPAQNNGAAPGEGGDVPALFGGAQLSGEKGAFKKVHHGHQQIAHEHAVENGHHGAQQLPADPQQHPAGKKRVVKEQNGRNGAKYRKTCAHIDIFLHGRRPFGKVRSRLFYPKGGGIAILILKCYTFWEPI